MFSKFFVKDMRSFNSLADKSLPGVGVRNRGRLSLADSCVRTPRMFDKWW